MREAVVAMEANMSSLSCLSHTMSSMFCLQLVSILLVPRAMVILLEIPVPLLSFRVACDFCLKVKVSTRDPVAE